MPILGKMSVGMRSAASGPKIRMHDGQHEEGVGPLQRNADDPGHIRGTSPNRAENGQFQIDSALCPPARACPDLKGL